MKRIFPLLAGFVALFTLTGAPVQSGHFVTPRLQTQAQPEVETLFGTVLKDGQNYVLSDSATKSRYTLDNAAKASRYEGMTVKVTGTVDLATNLIRVDTIQQIV